uniref:DnaJ heat shock protein family (Hsp40) member C8 n=1 Tax=Ornithorhynchus anatinus TaxID=9258 RepID=A0A6I8N2V0_ORNAN
MAASGVSGASGGGGGGGTEEAFMTFYSEVKQIEKRDSVLTSKNQIERLTRPGSSYFNLNPFEHHLALKTPTGATDDPSEPLDYPLGHPALGAPRP